MIIKSGKRIDGCTDTVPVGTIQPFLGLVPPSGYLVCQGQKVSKTTYPKLYEICGDLFGKSTEEEFYLPDLRGKTIVGYDADNSTLNTLGALIGAATHTHTSAAHVHSVDGHTHTSAAHTHTIAGHTHTSAAHTHTTGNHTLTVAEMPSHNHPILANKDAGGDHAAAQHTWGTAYQGYDTNSCGYTGGSGAHNHGNTGSTTPGNTGSTSLTSNSTTPGATGSTTLTTKSTTPGNTGNASNYQPSITMNWIVKAVMLIPEYFVVENSLTSASSENALSAAQGKFLNETKLSLSGGIMSGPITCLGDSYWPFEKFGLDLNNSDIIRVNSIYMNDFSGVDEGLHFKRSNQNWDSLRVSDGNLYLVTDRTLDGATPGTEYQIATRADIDGTVVFNGQGSGNWLAQDTTYSYDVSAYKYLLVHFTATGVNNASSRESGNAVNQVVYVDLTTPTEYPICNVDGVFYHYGGTETHLDMQFLFGVNHDPGMFFSGIFVSADKKKIYVGNAGYVVLGTSEPAVQWGSLYNGVSRIVGFK